MRIAPQWFLSKLKAIDRRLGVVWVDALQRWRITETVPWAVRVGPLGDAMLYGVNRRRMRIFYCEELGSRVLDWIRRLDMRRFSSIEEMEEELEMDKTENTSPSDPEKI